MFLQCQIRLNWTIDQKNTTGCPKLLLTSIIDRFSTKCRGFFSRIDLNLHSNGWLSFLTLFVRGHFRVFGVLADFEIVSEIINFRPISTVYKFLPVSRQSAVDYFFRIDLNLHSNGWLSFLTLFVRGHFFVFWFSVNFKGTIIDFIQKFDDPKKLDSDNFAIWIHWK